MLEKKRQKKFNQRAKLKGWKCGKIRYEGQSGALDCIYMKQGLVVFIEWKKPGGRLQESQKLEIEELDEQLIINGVFDDPEEAEKWLDAIDAKRHEELSDSCREIFTFSKTLCSLDGAGVRENSNFTISSP
jgi:hypothetical protein